VTVLGDTGERAGNLAIAPHLTLHLFILDWIIADVTVADALLGIRGDERDVTGSNNNKSVYATVRRFRLAAEMAESNRTYSILPLMQAQLQCGSILNTSCAIVPNLYSGSLFTGIGRYGCRGRMECTDKG
jgi:hypothetical protein